MKKNFKNICSVMGILAVSTLLTSCNQSRPIKTFDTFTEMSDPTADVQSDWSAAKVGLNASFVSIDNKYAKSILPTVDISKSHKITGWKGETLSAQMLLWTSEDITQVECEFEDFKSASTSLPSSIGQARFVRYVMTDEFAEGCGHRKPENYAAALAPDMLDNLDNFNMEAKTARPVWLTVEIPRDAKDGTYNTTISLYAKGKETQKFALELEVLNETLPKPSDWKFHLDQWQHPSAVARVQNVKMWSDEHFEALRPVMKRLADAGQKVITANINKDPWNNQCFDAYEDMIIWTKNEDGTWTYDYTVFDKWVSFMMDLGVKKMINCYSVVPWNNEIHYTDGKSGELINIKADPGTKIFDDMWGAFLPDFVKHLKAKGWLEITNIAMDERSPKDMDATVKMLHKVAPELGIALADNHKSYKKYPFIKDMCVGAEAFVDQADKDERRAKGLTTTYYVCCSHGFPNQFTFSDAAESTYIAWYAIAADYDGFLRWAYNSWVENPLTDSRFRTWPAGDTYIVYPDNRSSIRFERLLEGMQDVAKVDVIKAKLSKDDSNEGKANLEKLNTAIAKLNTIERTATWNKDLNDAKALVNELTK